MPQATVLGLFCHNYSERRTSSNICQQPPYASTEDFTRRELLAVIRFTRQFCHYLLGRKFLKQTDHGSLTWLFRFKCPEGQLAHWLEELSRYDFHIEQAVNTQMQMPCQGEPKNSPMNVTVTKLE